MPDHFKDLYIIRALKYSFRLCNRSQPRTLNIKSDVKNIQLGDIIIETPSLQVWWYKFHYHKGLAEFDQKDLHIQLQQFQTM